MQRHIELYSQGGPAEGDGKSQGHGWWTRKTVVGSWRRLYPGTELTFRIGRRARLGPGFPDLTPEAVGWGWIGHWESDLAFRG